MTNKVPVNDGALVIDHWLCRKVVDCPHPKSFSPREKDFEDLAC